jgi:hypothetical protein
MNVIDYDGADLQVHAFAADAEDGFSVEQAVDCRNGDR